MVARFSSSMNSRAMFLEPSYIEAADLQLFTDASSTHRFGAFFAGEWLRGDWTQSQKQCFIQ